jgi:hypothetical protein
MFSNRLSPNCQHTLSDCLSPNRQHIFSNKT